MPKKYTEASTLADVLTTGQGRSVIAEFFDDVCLTCPAVKGETLGVSAHFHGVDIGRLLSRLNSSAGRASGKKN
jgi:hypothetical protein